MARIIETNISIGGILDPSVQKAFAKMGEYSSNISSKLASVGKAAAGGALAIGATFGVSGAAFSEYDEALRQMLGSTGAIGEKAEILKGTMQEVYADNFGESWGDVASAISTVNKLLGGTKEQVKESTENAFTFKDTFGAEIPESIRASKTLMDQFGLSNTQAFNLMSQGEQNGLDYSGELLDSINEYSVQFKKFGFNAEDMFNVFSGGAADGAFNLDKIGDAVKEFSIRAIDGSKTSIDGFTQLGFSADEMAKKFASGGDASKEAFAQVTQAMGKMDDPVQQSIVGTELFGSMWEDLGPKVITQLGNMGDNFNANYETMKQISDIKYTSFSSGLTGISRQLETSLIPLGETLVPYMNKFANWFSQVGVPKIKEFANFIGTSLPDYIQKFKDSLSTIMPILITVASAFAAFTIISKVITIIGALGKAFAFIKTIGFAFSAFAGGAATLGEAMALIMGPVGWITLAIVGLIAGIVLLYQKCEPFREFINSAIASIVGWFQGSLLPAIQSVASSVLNFWNSVLWPFIQWIATQLAPVFVMQFNQIKNVVVAVFSSIGEYIMAVIQTFQGFIDFITGVFTGNWDLAWQGIVGIFSGIFEQIVIIAKTPLNAIIGMINGVISGINSIGSIELPEALGGMSIGLSIPEIPMLAKGGITNGVSIAGEAGPEAVIPLKRNNPRSLSLLEKTAGAIGATNGTSSGSHQFVFAPQIGSNVDSETVSQLKQSFEEWKDMILSVMDDERRESYEC